MSSSITESTDILPMLGKRLNPVELKIDLLCRGIRIDGTCRIEEDGRPLSNEPADLASGLEMILPGDMSELWVNAPVREKFVENSPYYLLRVRGAYRLFDERHDLRYSVKLPPKPDWYDLRTSRGIPMSRIGMLRGTCLVVSLGEQRCFEDREGALHGGFCMEFFNKDYFDRLALGRSKAVGQESYLRALEYCAHAFGKGRVSGKIIAGIEPIEDSLRAVDYFTGIGVLPLVCIFRPLPETDLEAFPPPQFAEMVRVFRHVYEACRAHNLPIGMTPNIHLSVLPHPEDTLYLAPDSLDGRTYQSWVFTMKQVMRPYFLRRMRKSKVLTL